MTMLSLVCMLLLSCSALANNYRTAQRDVAPVQSGYGSSSSLLDTVQQPTNSYGSSQTVQSTGFGSQQQQQQQPQLDQTMSSSYGSSSVQPMRRKIQQSRFRDMSRGYGQQISSPVFLDQQQQTSSYGGYGQQRLPSFDTPRIFSYGSQYGNGEQQFDIPQAPVQQPTQWDILCQNQAPETIIVLSDQASWVVCVDTGKGQLQSCQAGLIFVKETNKCERRSKGDHPCNSNPCKYGGQCVPTSQSEFQCQCTPGYDGPTCELDARVCQQQNPCGQEQCQSFDVGAALSYVCLIGGNQAYGPSSSKATPNPCANAPNGIPQPLSYTSHGFLLCDGEQMHIKACPGATIWDSNSLTCAFPPGAFQQDQVSSYGYSQQQQRLPVRDIPSVSSYGYGQQQQQQPILRDLPVMSSYGSSIQQQQRDTPVISSGYGSSLPQVQQRDMTSSGYGQQTSFVQPTPTIFREQSSSSYGGSSSLRDLPNISSGYGQQQQQQQPIIPQPAQLRDTVVPSSSLNSYGSSQTTSSFRDIQQTPMQQSSFGGVGSQQKMMTGLFDNTPVQQQSSFGGSRVRDVPVQSSYGQKSSY